MLIYKNQDLMSVDQGFITHGVNCSGRFGSGVAGQIKKKWPVVYRTFKKYAASPDLLGTAHIILIEDRLWVANCYTQQSYGSDGQRYADPDAIERTLRSVVSLANVYETDVYLPKIGCGLGGLDWDIDVEPRIVQVSIEFPSVNMYVCTLEK